VLLFDAPTTEPASEAASYLARHLGLALRNLGRFAEVEDLAYLDDLTHLFNTRYLHMVLEQELREAERAPEAGNVFSLLFLDLDRFKAVNDTHGHLVGSKVIVEAGRVVKGCVRDRDVVARFGGDEYVVLLRATDSGGALKVAERIRRTMETHHFLAREGLSLSVSTCIGVVSYPEHAQDKATLLDLADRAMYRGKRGSRNVVYMAARDLEATPAARHAPPGERAP
jgi:two-component system, cell cycle response regulator